MRGVLLGLVLVFFISAPLIHATTIEYSGLVDIYYQCGAYVTNFGTCAGNCFGFIMAIGDTAERPPVHVYIGNTEASVNYTLYHVDDLYQPNLWVAEFWGNGSGSVRVETWLGVEAYLLVNFGVGKPMYVKVLTLPYFAGRGEAKPWEVQLGANGNLLVCTVGKYAASGEVFYNGSWRPASVSIGWYHSVVSGSGSAVKLYWSNTPESAIKVAYVVLTTPKGPDRAFVVGIDGLPVPAQFLRLMAGPGVTVEGDGVVSFFGTGYLTYGGRQIELRPNATVVVEGRRCLYVGRTSTGEPLDVEVLLDGKPVVSGRGQIEAFCIPGATQARYTYRIQSPITDVVYTVETNGNYTLPLVEMEIIVHDLYLRPVKDYVIETPPNISLTLVLPDYNYQNTVTAFAGKLDIYPNPLSYLLQILLSILGEIGKNNMKTTSNLYIYYLLIGRFIPYPLIEASILIFLIYYMLLLFARKSIYGLEFRLLNPILFIINGILPLVFINIYSIIYFILFILLYIFIRTDIFDKLILNIFVLLLFALSISVHSGMPISYFVAWTPVLILSLHVILFFRYFRLVRHFSISEIILSIMYILLFVLILVITIPLGVSDLVLALVLTLLLLPASRVAHTLYAVHSSFPSRNIKKAEDSYRTFSEKELLRKKVSELLCRLIQSRRLEGTTCFEIPPHRIELNARFVGGRADLKKFELTAKARDLGISYGGTAVMQKTDIGWALASLQVADMSESYPPPSGGEGACSGVAIQVVFFLLALALFVINTSAGLFFAVVLTYIFHRTICESLRLGWRNVVIKLFIFIIALSILIIVAWFLAGPYMVAIINIINYIINNVRQIIYPGNVAALSGRWPYILLISLMLFYTPIVHQDRRCLAP